nr:putative integron gene cassette protein [uncultured bacterium]
MQLKRLSRRAVRNRVLMVGVVVVAAAGCGDSHSPQEEPIPLIDSAELHGSWEEVAQWTNGVFRVAQPGMCYWLFTAKAELCSMELGWWEYNPVLCGQLEAGNLIRAHRFEFDVEYHLELSAAGDTLFAELKSPEQWGPYTKIMVRSACPAEPSCDCWTD